MKAVPAHRDGVLIGHRVYCPACRCTHLFNCRRDGYSGPGWTFDGNTEAPTFSPSMLVRSNPKDHAGYNPRVASSVCHSYVNAGRIQYLSDCTHAMAGQTIDLPDVPENWKNG